MKGTKGKLYSTIVLLLSTLICFIAGITLMSSPTAAFAEEVHYGDGTGDVYLISSEQDLYNLSQTPADWSKNFKLTKDIDLSAVCYEGVSWTTIGNGSIKFTGAFDGDDHTISGLYIDSTAGGQGLFGYVENGTIKNLKVKGTVIGNGNAGGIDGYVGGIVGYFNIGTVEKCSFEGTVKGGSLSQAVGGIAGYNHNGTIKKCSNSGEVSSWREYAGGIVGQNYGQNSIVTDCENTGTISLIDSTSSSSTAGGIVGINVGGSKIMNCSNTGKIGEGNNLIIGGIVGTNNGSSVTQCYNTGIVTGSNYIGGVAGQNTAQAKITQCYNTGAVSGSLYIGGVAGQNDDGATIISCYNTATVTGSSNVGGLVGKNYGGSSKQPTLGTVKNCYNRGTVTGNNSGGVVGLNKINNSEGTVENCYYLTNTAAGGINKADTAGATVKTEAAFNSGEIAWLLQHGQSAQVWGQWLNNDIGTKQDYPVLVQNEPQMVRKVAFIKGGEEIGAKYVNHNGTTTALTTETWCYPDGTRFKSSDKITQDVILGIGVNFGGATNTVITATYGEAVQQDLDDWIAYENGDFVGGRFTYGITDNGGIEGANIAGNILNIPQDVNVKEGGYTLKITAHEETPLVDSEIRTLSALPVTDFGREDVILTVQVIIGKANQSEFTINELPNGVTYGCDPFTLSTSGGWEGGTVSWSVTKGSEYASVNSDGLVTVSGVGDVEITAVKSGGNNYNDISDIFEFTVNKANQQALTISGLPGSVGYLDSFTLEANGGSYESGKVTWEITGGSEYAEINSDGLVTITGVGNIEITATKEGGANYNPVTATITFESHKANQDALTISGLPQSVTYNDGQQITLTVNGGSGAGAIGWTCDGNVALSDESGKAVTVTVNGAGEVTITATKAEDDNYNSTSVSISFTVHKANQEALVISGLPSNLDYRSADFTLEVTEGSSTGAIRWTATGNVELTQSNVNPAQVTVKITGIGEVAITATRAEDNNYNEVSATITFTISKATQDALTISNLPESITYGDSDFYLTVTGGWDGGEIEWSASNKVTVTQDADNPARATVKIDGAGENVTITVIKRGGDNYNDISASIHFTINKANQAAFAISGPQEVTFGGEDFTLTAVGGWADGTVTWRITEGNAFAEIKSKNDGTEGNTGNQVTIHTTSAGTVTITATKSGGSNYNDVSATITFTVDKATQAAFSITGLPQSVTYNDGQQITLTAEGGSSGETVTWTASNGNVTVEQSGTTVTVTINGAGNVTITATKPGGENYIDISASITFTINKANQKALTITGLPESVTFGDSPFTLGTNGGSYEDGNVTWTYSGNIAVDGNGRVTVTGAGSATITATKSGGFNYNPVSTSITFTINKANQQALNIVGLPQGVTYNDGQQITLSADGGSGTGAFIWVANDDKITIVGNGKDVSVTVNGAGEVTITLTKEEDSNYNSISASITFTINKANQSDFTLSGLPGSVSCWGDFELTPNGGTGDGEITWSASDGISVNYDGNVAQVMVNCAGDTEVTITATKSGGANYYDISASVTFTVHKVNQNNFAITELPASVTYNDAPFKLNTDGGVGDVTWQVTAGNEYVTIVDDLEEIGKGLVTILGAGEVTITAIKSGNEYYNPVSASITFTVNKATQDALTIVGLPSSIKYDDIQFTLTAEGGTGDGNVIWKVTEGDCVIVDHIGEVTIIGTGRVTITATKAGNDNYNDISTIVSFTVEKATPEYTLPEGLTAIYGNTLASVVLPYGWKWEDDTLDVGTVGIHSFSAIYNNGDSANYNEAIVSLTVTVEKATPQYTIPGGLTAIYGNTLADVRLPEGWAWDEELTTKVGNAGVNAFSATFTPADTQNYNNFTVFLTITVEKAVPQYTIPDGLTATVGDTLADVKLPEGWKWDDELTTKVGKAGERYFTATFTPSDTENYETVTLTLTIKVENKRSGFWWWWILLIVLIVVGGAVFAVIFFLKKRKKDDEEEPEKEEPQTAEEPAPSEEPEKEESTPSEDTKTSEGPEAALENEEQPSEETEGKEEPQEPSEESKTPEEPQEPSEPQE